MELGQIIAFNLKKLRKDRNLSLGQLAAESGINKTMLSDIEKGSSNPTINTIWKIANGLKVPYTKLIDGVEDGPHSFKKRKQLSKRVIRKLIACIVITQPHRHEILSSFIVS